MSKKTHTVKMLEEARNKSGFSNSSILKKRINKLQHHILGNGIVSNELFKIEQEISRRDTKAISSKKVAVYRFSRSITHKQTPRVPRILSELSHCHVFSSESGRLICQKVKEAVKNYEEKQKQADLSNSLDFLPNPKKKIFDPKRLYPQPKMKEESRSVKKLTMKYSALFDKSLTKYSNL